MYGLLGKVCFRSSALSTELTRAIGIPALCVQNPVMPFVQGDLVTARLGLAFVWHLVAPCGLATATWPLPGAIRHTASIPHRPEGL